jgi:hypothetical protein
MTWVILCTDAYLLLKTQLFLSFQIIEAARISSVLDPWLGVCTLASRP